MAGAAAVIGVINTVVKNKIKQNVIGVIASCENKVTDISYVPGDIIGSMAGKTIEIINTDAEGRLTLADAVTYIIRKEQVTKVIDIATLTGAVVGALGFTTTGVVSNNDEFYDKFIEASHRAKEQFWRFPAYEEQQEMIKSKVADLKNVGGNHSGTITAGLFIEAFTEDKPWIHLDIAGTAWTDSPGCDYLAAGATGTCVKTLYYFLEQNN